MIDRRKQMLEWYGFELPDDFFAVWEFAKELCPDDPRNAFDTISLSLDGLYDVLRGEFDKSPPTGPLWTHGMSYWDSPEFFTVLWGNCDGYHLGLWFDDPADPPSCVVSYYNNDAYDLGHYPPNLFLTLRCQLELCYKDHEDDPDHSAGYPVAEQDELREKLRSRMPGATKRRKKTGWAYLDAHDDVSDRNVVAYTWGRECIVAEPHLYRRPSVSDEIIWQEVREPAGAERWLAEAERALRDGYPATTLKLTKDVYHLARAHRGNACEVMKAAYHALGRPLLAEVLQAREEQRNLWDAEREARTAKL